MSLSQVFYADWIRMVVFEELISLLTEGTEYVATIDSNRPAVRFGGINLSDEGFDDLADR